VTSATPPGAAPEWLSALAGNAALMAVPPPLRPPAGGGGRPSAVLMLVGESAGEPDLLIVQRSPWLRRHAGQPAFPGGAIEAADRGPVGAALREAAEEAGVDPAGVEVLAVLPELYIARSGFSVTPVLAWWRTPVPVVPAADG
jgi:8-oxo-dGTP pyrophosphatase MutT (NUDIX family)